MYILNSFLVKICCFLLLCFSCPLLAGDLEIILPENKVMQGGWYTLDPYLYQKEENDIKSLHGLDFELMRVISKEVGKNVTYDHVFWDDLLHSIQTGRKDFATGALFSKERARYAYYSIPYRWEENSIFLMRTKLKEF